MFQKRFLAVFLLFFIMLTANAQNDSIRSIFKQSKVNFYSGAFFRSKAFETTNYAPGTGIEVGINYRQHY